MAPFIMRLDLRLTRADIDMRMEYVRANIPPKSVIEMSILRLHSTH